MDMCEMTVAVPRRRPGGPELIGAVDTAEPAPDPLAAHMGATIGGRENRTGLSGAPTAAWRLSAEATESAVGSLLCLRSRARCCNGRWRGSSFEAGVPSVRASFALLRRTTLPARPVAGMPRDRGKAVVMPENDDRCSRRRRKLRQAGAWAGAAAVYAAAQGLSAWRLSASRAGVPGPSTASSNVQRSRRPARLSRSCGRR
jgi:hypothetical protein